MKKRPRRASEDGRATIAIRRAEKKIDDAVQECVHSCTGTGGHFGLELDAALGVLRVLCGEAGALAGIMKSVADHYPAWAPEIGGGIMESGDVQRREFLAAYKAGARRCKRSLQHAKSTH